VYFLAIRYLYIFCGHLVGACLVFYGYMVSVHIVWSFGIFYTPRKIWQPCVQRLVLYHRRIWSDNFSAFFSLSPTRNSYSRCTADLAWWDSVKRWSHIHKISGQTQTLFAGGVPKEIIYKQERERGRPSLGKKKILQLLFYVCLDCRLEDSF
jgi:hypothetical protein